MKAKTIVEALGIGGVKFNTHEIGPFERVWAGEKGILGEGGVFIPWDFIDTIMKKYRR